MAKMYPPKKTSYYLVSNYPFVVWDKQSALEDLRNAQTRVKFLGFEFEGEFIPVYSTADSMTYLNIQANQGQQTKQETEILYFPVIVWKQTLYCLKQNRVSRWL